MPLYTGTSGNDTMVGSTGADTLDGGAGNDTYTVNSLGDIIIENSGSGTDTVLTSVLDSLATYSLAPWQYVENLTYTGTLAAQLKGNSLSNVIKANSAVSVNDTLYGDAGNDTLYGYGGNDLLKGGSGNDSMDGGSGDDTLVGGSGNDIYLVNASGDRVFEYAGEGFDTIVSAVAKDLRVSWADQVEGLTYNGTSAAVLYGNALGNLLQSLSATADTLNGYAGDDTLDGGSGNDSMIGGTGNDFYFVSSGDAVSELVDEGTDTLIGTRSDLSVSALATTVENLFFTSSTGTSLLGNGLSNVISGGAGNDTVSGGEGADTLLGGAGADSLSGGNGNDVLYGASNNGYVYVAGRLLVADTAVDKLNGGNGNDGYLIDNTNDTVVESTSGGTLDVVISTIDNTLSRYANVEALVLQTASTAWTAQGTSGNNILVGNEADNYLVGGAGNDTLSGFANIANYTYAQSDILDGGDGADVLLVFDFGAGYGSLRGTSLLGGAGNDLYILGAPADSYGGQDTGGIDTAVMTSSGSIAKLEGVENVVLYGADSGIDASTRSQISLVYAAATLGGTYSGSFGSAYDATGNELANQMFGNAQNNHLTGGAGNDTLIGNAGNDTLEGGTGVDSLVGGSGDDWFYLDTGDIAVEATNSGFDVLASLTISSFTGYANFEGLQYLGSTGVALNRGSTNTSNDFLGGGTGKDTISGYGGQDTLDGGAGNDTLSGGDGNDSLRGAAGNDSVLGGNGEDTADGGDGADTLHGDLGDDRLQGGAGNDLVDGGGNFDNLQGGDGDDTLTGSDGDDTLEGNAGNDLLHGDAQNDLLIGDAGVDEIWGGSNASLSTFSADGDQLWGGEQYGHGDGSLDLFVFDTVSTDNGAIETGPGSGQFNFLAGATICDFEPGIDLIAISKSFVGDLDGLIEGAVVKTTAGATFSAAAELVIVRPDVAAQFAYSTSSSFSAINAPAVTAAIGSASAPIAAGQTKLFVVDDGSHSALFLFQSADGNAAVTIDELFLLTVITGQTALVASDFTLF